jgi:hypothetical protein
VSFANHGEGGESSSQREPVVHGLDVASDLVQQGRSRERGVSGGEQ